MNNSSDKKEPGSRLPDWFNDLATRYNAGIAHQFILHGNISDLVTNFDMDDESDKPYISFRQFLEKVFDERPMVIFYNIASGISFLNKQMEAQFREITGSDVDMADSNNPVAAAKNALSKKRGIPREPEACLPLIEKALTNLEDVAVVISYAHMLAPSSSGTSLASNDRTNTVRLVNWAQSEEIKEKGSIILLLTNQIANVSSQLKESSSSVQTIFIPRASQKERKDFLRSITEGNKEYQEIQKTLEKFRSKKGLKVKEEIQKYQEKLETFSNIFPVPKNFNLEIFSLATQGMSYRQIFEIFLRSKEEKKEISLEYVKGKKKEILNSEYGDVMEICEPKKGLEDIGGLEHIKTYLKSVLRAIEKGEDRLVPMGITLMGPPGTGKTAIVESLAKEAGFNFVKIKNLRSMWVGESETRGEKLTYGLRSLAPVVVNNDEADLAEASRDSSKGDSGVSERLMKMWMELLSDPKIRGKIIIISCTNRPDRIDAALKRSGRSDDRILIPMPSKPERSAIFQVMFKRHKIPTIISDFSKFAELTEGSSGADIEKISLNAYRFASVQSKKGVDEIALEEAIKDFIPSASQIEIDTMTLMAILESSSRRLLPLNVKEIIAKIKARNLVENLDAILSQIKERNIIGVD
ncbi:MAG: ATP-binding protein [Patescibacteria group bacterium]|nr:ATP-binding protein [Patescibacteria group bacterium]MDD5164091.1 ATP-binding protein [Patescibacteria group bacterium]MDD5534251.1 ATP-binding protein [Patescibacteria group bacterium]